MLIVPGYYLARGRHGVLVIETRYNWDLTIKVVCSDLHCVALHCGYR